MRKLLNIFLSLMMVASLMSVNFNSSASVVHAEEPAPSKNSIKLNVGWDDGCKSLVNTAAGQYSL